MLGDVLRAKLSLKRWKNFLKLAEDRVAMEARGFKDGTQTRFSKKSICLYGREATHGLESQAKLP